MALPLPPNYSDPIPNDPFYYPNEEALASSTGPLIVGAGLAVDYANGFLVAAGGGLANITATLPLYKTGTQSNPVINIETANKFRLGAVQVGTNLDLSGNGVINVLQSSTIQKGVVQLADNVNTPSKFLALTANQGYLLQQQINSLSFATDLIFSGTFNPTVPEMVNVTTKGQEAGFVQGANLPLPDTTNEAHFVIVAERGIYTPPGGVTPIDAHVGSWFLSNGTEWRYLKINEQVPSATETSEGIIRLATLQEALDGVNDTAAITSCKMAQVSVEKCNYTAKGTILAGEGAGVPVALPVGTDGQFLTADSNENAGIKWVDKPAAIPCSIITQPGSLIAGDTSSVPTEFPLGTSGQFLRVNPAAASGVGLEWVTVTNTFAIPCSCLTGAGALVTADGPGSPIPLPRGTTDGQLLSVCLTSPTGGLTWCDNDRIPCNLLTNSAKGTLLSSDGAGNLALGVPQADTPDGAILKYSALSPSGLVWEPDNYLSCDLLVGNKGALLTGTDTGICVFPVPSTGKTLVTNTSCPSGLEWVAAPPTTAWYQAITPSTQTIDQGDLVRLPFLQCAFGCGLPGCYQVNIWGWICTRGNSKGHMWMEEQGGNPPPQSPIQRWLTQGTDDTRIPYSLSWNLCNKNFSNFYICSENNSVDYEVYMTALRYC